MTTEQNEQEMLRREERRRIDAIYWGGVVLWAGLVFGAESLGYLPQIGKADAWSWIFFGAGLYALVGDIYRVASPNYSNPTTWDYIWAIILLIIGLGGVTSLEITWPLILALVGAAILVSTLFRR